MQRSTSKYVPTSRKVCIHSQINRRYFHTIKRMENSFLVHAERRSHDVINVLLVGVSTWSQRRMMHRKSKTRCRMYSATTYAPLFTSVKCHVENVYCLATCNRTLLYCTLHMNMLHRRHVHHVICYGRTDRMMTR
jgi:hypothetical protein